MAVQPLLGLNSNYRKQRLIHADDSLCSNLGVDTRRHHGVGLQARQEVQGGNLRHHSNRGGLFHPPQCTRIRVDSRSTRGDFDVHDGDPRRGTLRRRGIHRMSPIQMEGHPQAQIHQGRTIGHGMYPLHRRGPLLPAPGHLLLPR